MHGRAMSVCFFLVQFFVARSNHYVCGPVIKEPNVGSVLLEMADEEVTHSCLPFLRSRSVGILEQLFCFLFFVASNKSSYGCRPLFKCSRKTFFSLFFSGHVRPRPRHPSHDVNWLYPRFAFGFFVEKGSHHSETFQNVRAFAPPTLTAFCCVPSSVLLRMNPTSSYACVIEGSFRPLVCARCRWSLAVCGCCCCCDCDCDCDCRRSRPPPTGEKRLRRKESRHHPHGCRFR